jgi:hypothetical protein
LQVRINIECAFGMFVHRWGILRKAIPANIGMKRTTALVMCLGRLHNFCIDSRLASSTADLESVPEVPPALSSDEDEIRIAGGIILEAQNHQRQTTAPAPEVLLNGGEHFDDVDRGHIRAIEREAAAGDAVLPRDLLHDLVVVKGLVRPAPAAWRN